MREIIGDNKEVNTWRILGVTVLKLSYLLSEQFWVKYVAAYHI
jgi:hypothetical protein